MHHPQTQLPGIPLQKLVHRDKGGYWPTGSVIETLCNFRHITVSPDPGAPAKESISEYDGLLLLIKKRAC